MPKSIRHLVLGLLLTLPAALATVAAAQTAPGTGFTYQGQLALDGLPVTGTCDFQFTLWDAAGSGTPPSGGSALGVAVTLSSVAVDHGVFTVLLNAANEFGAFAFNGDARWLQIAVRSPAGAGAWTVLSPRQALTQTPVAATLRPGALVTARQQTYGLSVYNLSTAPETGILGVGGASATTGTRPAYDTVYDVGVNGTSANGFGVMGSSNAAPGVLGSSADAPGVMGWSVAGDGVRGYGGTGGDGVKGEAGSGGAGVHGVGAGGGLAGRFDGNVQVSGNINAPGFNAGVIINQSGGLPVTANYTTHGGTLLLFVSGSGHGFGPNTMLGMNVLVDGVVVGQVTIWSETGTRTALVPKQFVVTGLAAGAHAIRLEILPSAPTDGRDVVFASVVELPF